VDPNPGNIPWCFYKVASPAVYLIDTFSKTSWGYEGYVKLNDTSSSQIPRVYVNVSFESSSRFHIKFTDPSKARWEIPESILPTPGIESTDSFNYGFAYSEPNTPASFVVTRKSDGVVLMNASGLQFGDTYLSISTSLDTKSGPNVYGLGEHVDPFRLSTNSHSYTMWSADVQTPVDENLYGSHPFYLELHNDGTADGVFLRSSNGMDVFLYSDHATFNVNGGVIDLYLLTGPSPTQVIQQYHQVIGKPMVPPYWSLGWHQCRYGYPNIQFTEQVVQNYSKAGIPLETIWNDIDYMQNYEDWTWDSNNYPQAQVASFVQQLHADHQHYVVIIDPGIHVRSGYGPYDSGLQQKIFLMKSDGVTPFVGQVWPGQTTFPSFFHPDAQTWWNSNFEGFLNGVPIDGIWIDMNEISNFQDGNAVEVENATLGDPLNPTYRINNLNNHAALNAHTTGMNCLHYGGILEYDVHNLFGFLETIATNKMLVAHYNKKPFVLSRSTFAGAGKWGAHWLGDNQSTWQSLISSIAGILDMNMFGIPFVGADICGFMQATTEELCARWSAVGAFYPFSRNHDNKEAPNQEPYLWPSVTQVAIKTLNARYSILPYLYTLFWQASQNGGQVAQALLFAFPNDPATYAIDQQFMLGPAILITPVLTQGATSVKGYFPDAAWYSFWDGTPLTSTGNVTLQAALTDIPVHVLGGNVVPQQEPGMTIYESRNNPYMLLVALDKSGAASGTFYLDDGETVNVGDNYSLLTYTVKSGNLTGTVVKSAYAVTPLLNTINIFGVSKVSTVTVNGGSKTFNYNSTSLVLNIASLQLPLLKGLTVTWA
jgi:alpha-glucosidase (family GH31 glycosyl hydrolase)